MRLNYVHCANIECNKILEPNNEAVEHNGMFYCFDCYEDIITEEQNESL